MNSGRRQDKARNLNPISSDLLQLLSILITIKMGKNPKPKYLSRNKPKIHNAVALPI